MSPAVLIAYQQNVKEKLWRQLTKAFTERIVSFRQMFEPDIERYSLCWLISMRIEMRLM